MRGIARSRGLVLVMTAWTAAGCAGSTIGSGVGDRLLGHPPYYAGRTITDTGRIAHFPVTYQRGATDAEILDPSGKEGSPIAALLRDMNLFLDSLGLSIPTAAIAPRVGTPPDVRFGCQSAPGDECESDEAGGSDPEMWLAVARPSDRWTAELTNVLRDADARQVLLVTLEVGQYWPRQKDWRGSKEVELGTGYSVPLPWLTGLDRPISVLQLTGALIGEDGRALRIGAEGMIARRTNLLLGALGAQVLISDEDVEKLRASRREDLRDQPLVWQVALRNLVVGLTDR